MGKSKKQTKTKSEEVTNKEVLKYATIFIVVVGFIFVGIWFGREWIASEELISITNINVNGKPYRIVLSEKSGRQNFKDQMNQVDIGAPHYAYFLELKDAEGLSSFSKVRFKSPVMNIQETPVVVVIQNTIWLVSTTRSEDRDEQGFILKFLISDDVIARQDFKLDEKYKIRELNGSRVYLDDGTRSFVRNHAYYGGLYLDLSLEKVIDDRRN